MATASSRESSLGTGRSHAVKCSRSGADGDIIGGDDSVMDDDNQIIHVPLQFEDTHFWPVKLIAFTGTRSIEAVVCILPNSITGPRAF